jgi:hypothetical protein
MTWRIQGAVQVAVIGLLLAFTPPGWADSLARAVRLSVVEGDVVADRHTGLGFERALPNMPVTQGMLVRTREGGRAEIEFEEGTVIRLGEDAELDFQQLSLRESGVKSTVVQLNTGTVYFHVLPSGSDEFALAVAQRSISLTRAAHFRAEYAGEVLKLADYRGELRVKRKDGESKIKQGEELTLNLSDDSYSLAKNITPSPSDGWDRQRSRYHQDYSANADYSSYPYYGRGDLNYYGGWYSLPGYGNLWQPYIAGPGWNPFWNGTWGWYSGIGYSWISPYPWGWLPFHYGSWVWVPGWGWGWLPGASWGWWGRGPIIVNGPNGFVMPAPPRLPNRPVLVHPGPNGTLVSMLALLPHASAASPNVAEAPPPTTATRMSHPPAVAFSPVYSYASQGGTAAPGSHGFFGHVGGAAGHAAGAIAHSGGGHAGGAGHGGR